MNCQFIKVWVIESGDGYTSTPHAYFSSKMQAQLYMEQHNGKMKWWSLRENPLDAIQIGNEFYLLGQKIDVDHAEEKKQEALITAAKGKLTPEELAALLGNKLP